MKSFKEFLNEDWIPPGEWNPIPEYPPWWPDSTEGICMPWNHDGCVEYPPGSGHWFDELWLQGWLKKNGVSRFGRWCEANPEACRLVCKNADDCLWIDCYNGDMDACNELPRLWETLCYETGDPFACEQCVLLGNPNCADWADDGEDDDDDVGVSAEKPEKGEVAPKDASNVRI